MRILNTIVCTIMLLASTVAVGQNSPKSQEELPVIEVIGNAEKEVIPDEIYVSITLSERIEGKDKITVEAQEAALKEMLLALNISLENLFLSDANANYVKIKWASKEVVTRTEYLLKLGDAMTVGKVFEKLDELKIKGAHISRVSHSKIEELKKEVRIMAIKAAKNKADYLLAAIGQETGKAIKVYEQSPTFKLDDSNLNIRGNRDDASYYYINGELDNSRVIQFEKIKLQATIYVKFEIK